MTTEVLISVVGAFTAITVSVIGAYLANKNSIVLQTRKLKEEHYVSYFETLHNLAENDTDVIKNYVLATVSFSVSTLLVYSGLLKTPPPFSFHSQILKVTLHCTKHK